MKLSKFIVFSSVLLAMVLTSCTGEDGADGLDGTNGINGADGNTGPAGTDGTNGTDGTDGTDGIDGNANVTHLSFEFQSGSNELSSQIQLDVEELTVEVLAEDTVLYYLVRDGGNPNAIAYYSIPGLGLGGSYTIGVFAQAGTATISFKEFDGSDYQLAKDEYTGAKVVIIESSNQTTSKSLAVLKSAGIDVNDYRAVAKHFNLQ